MLLLKSFSYRLISLIPLLFLISSITFFIMQAIPGDPTDLLLGDLASELDRKNLRDSLGLNQSLFNQYLDFITKLFKFNLGESLLSGKNVSSLIAERFPATLELSLFSILLSCLWGIPAGVLTASTKNKAYDFLGTSTGVLGMSIPGYFLGPLLIWLFAVYLGLLPVGGKESFKHLILPSLSLALPLGAILMRMTRSAIQDVLTEDYIRVAYSKGISRKILYFKHALKNALIPIITIVGLQIGSLLTGTVITETIFSWPGIGTLLFDAIQQRDYPIVQGCIIVIAIIYIVVNFITDTLYTIANPRVQST